MTHANHAAIDPIETTTKAVDALLSAIDGAPAVGAVTAYRAAITRHGRQLAEVAGAGALDSVVSRIKTQASDEMAAQDRERILSLAWEGIAG